MKDLEVREKALTIAIAIVGRTTTKEREQSRKEANKIRSNSFIRSYR